MSYLSRAYRCTPSVNHLQMIVNQTYIETHTYTHRHPHAHTHTHTNKQIHEHIHTHTHTHTYTCTHTHTQTNTYILWIIRLHWYRILFECIAIIIPTCHSQYPRSAWNQLFSTMSQIDQLTRLLNLDPTTPKYTLRDSKLGVGEL